MNLKYYYQKEKKIIQDNISKFKKQDIFKSFFFSLIEFSMTLKTSALETFWTTNYKSLTLIWLPPSTIHNFLLKKNGSASLSCKVWIAGIDKYYENE